jgi:response regulator NasT
VFSAFSSEDFIERANACHTLAYLVKPVQEKVLLATIPIVMQRFQELRALREEASGMRQALEDRKLIERAKGIIMVKRHLDEPNAFHYLQQLARSHRQKLVEVAKSVILAEQAFDPLSTT